jgi:cystathionine gamma-lyase
MVYQSSISTLPLSSLAHDIPYSRVISVCVRGGARSAEALLSKKKLFALAENLGGLESCGIPCADDICEYPACRT